MSGGGEKALPGSIWKRFVEVIGEMKYRVELPFFPHSASVSYLYHPRAGMRIYRSPSAAAWQREVVWTLRTRIGSLPEAWYQISISYFPPDRSRDPHDFLRLLLDAVQDGIGVDGRYLLVCEKNVALDGQDPRIILEIDEIETDG
jgi:Holliday junction resolvase RusA-like endonuclease